MVSHTEVEESRQCKRMSDMSMSDKRMSDERLIESFIEGFLQENMVLLSNQKLRTETLRTSMQLMSDKEGCIATANVYETPLSMMVRHGSSYGKLLHESLMAQSFYPLSRAKQETCYHYRFCEATAGYDLHCTTAKELWRACWGRGFGLRAGIPLDLLIWRQGPAGSKESWYSLRGMDCEQGQLTVKMLGWSDAVEGSELIVWAQQSILNDLGKRSVNSNPRLSATRGNLPFRH
jgi:hypothetical protein